MEAIQRAANNDMSFTVRL